MLYDVILTKEKKIDMHHEMRRQMRLNSWGHIATLVSGATTIYIWQMSM